METISRISSPPHKINQIFIGHVEIPRLLLFEIHVNVKWDIIEWSWNTHKTITAT